MFELPTWQELDLFTVELTQVFRQENAALIDVLCKLRRGEVDNNTLALLKTRSVAPPGASTGVKDLTDRARSRREDQADAAVPQASCASALEIARADGAQDVATENAREFAKLKTDIHRYTSEDFGFGDIQEDRMKKFLEPIQAVPSKSPTVRRH